MENQEKMRFAVYGTLRKGFGNHRLLTDTQFVGSGMTKEKYEMRASGIPFVNKTPTHRVRVELYETDNKTIIRQVDALEGHPEWYKREEIPVVLDDGTETTGWLYFMDGVPERLPIVEDGDYLKYRS